MNRLLCDVFIVTNEALPNSTLFLKDVMKMTYVTYTMSYDVHALSHSYRDGNLRSWEKRCIIYEEDHFGCLDNVVFRDTDFNLTEFSYRYVHPIYFKRISTSMFSQIENVTKPNGEHSYELVGGTDLHTITLLRRRFGFNIRTFHVYYNFAMPDFWRDNIMGQLYHNLADTIGGAIMLHVYYSPVSIGVVPNFHDINSGLTFYTALPQISPSWQAIVLVFQWNVWLPFIFAFLLSAILLNKVGLHSDYGKTVAWLLHTITGKGMGKVSMNTYSLTILALAVMWTIVATAITYVYTGGLTSVLTLPSIKKPPETWKELLDRNYAIKSFTEANTGEDVMGLGGHFTGPKGSIYCDILSRVNTDFGGGDRFRDIHSYHYTNKTQSDNYKRYLSTTNGLAIIWWAGNPYISFLFNSSGHYVLHVGKENTVPRFYTMVIRRQFLYSELWARELCLYWEMGLPRKWAKMENMKLRFASQRQLNAFENPPKVKSLPEEIRLEHIYGPLVLFTTSLAISLICFIFNEHYSTIKKYFL